MNQLNLFASNEISQEHKDLKRGLSDRNQFLGPKSPPMGYEKYIRSKLWSSKRAVALILKKHQCESCGSTRNLEVHHKQYGSLYQERLDDVEVLCRDCHPSADLMRRWGTAYETYMYKKYGDVWAERDCEYSRIEFDDWLARKNY